MDELTTRPGGAAQIPVPLTSAPFSASRREILAALALFPLAYLYVSYVFGFWYGWWVIALFTLGFAALTELLHRRSPRSRESWFWLGCMGLALTGLLLKDVSFDRDYIWHESEVALFLHAFAVWWVLCRGGRLAEGESGHLLPLDALNGFILFPFGHFFLRVRSLWYGLIRLIRPGKRLRPDQWIFIAAAVLASVLLFTRSARLLMRSDTGFAVLLEGVGEFFDRWDGDFLFRLALSLPVGAYLFGLLAGSAREDPAKLRERGERLCRGLEELRRVPAGVWTGLCGCFALLYLVFFIVQFRYLFGAFTRTLPEGFIVSAYARQGFFELCRVMALNFLLLWLTARSSAEPVREKRGLLAACLILLGESLLLAVVAASKLVLYIDCFGVTPLRLQSCWVVGVLAAGCGCAIFTLLRGKRSFRIWLFFSAGTLALLCLF